jgi:zeaxanthin glucosyltransferase
MARIGVISTPVPGHLHPMIALAGELKARGHELIFFHEFDVGTTVQSAGLAFREIGQSSCGPGHLTTSKAKLATLAGWSALKYTIAAVRETTEMIFRDAPAAVKAEKIDFLIVDQMEPAGASVAEYLGIPFVTVANALIINRDESVPPPFTPWNYRGGALARIRNKIGYGVSDYVLHSVSQTLARHRAALGLRALRSNDDSFSKLAQISQLVPEFDFPRATLPECFHYTGPLRRGSAYGAAFPYGKLDGRRLIFASLGTLQGSRVNLFDAIADACVGTDAQLVIAHGGGLTPDQAQRLSNRALVVPFAPQRELLERACLTITHAGLNTVLDSLSRGVPLVTLPITFEQPAIAARVRFCGAGETLPAARVTGPRLHELVEKVLGTRSYRENAMRIKNAIETAGGATRAADLVEAALLVEAA